MQTARVQWPSMNLDYGYLFKLTSQEDLDNYWLNCRSALVRKGFLDYLRSREFGEATGTSNVNPHVHTPEGKFLASIVQIEQLAEKPRSVVEVMAHHHDRVYLGMLGVLNNHGAIYVNMNGGYFNLGKDMVEQDAQDTDKFILPRPKLKITRWSEASHYYASVGGETVWRFGRNKWDTEKEARDQARKWAAENGIKDLEE